MIQQYLVEYIGRDLGPFFGGMLLFMGIMIGFICLLRFIMRRFP